MTATAKAAEAIAKTTGQALEIAHDTGGYLSRVFGDLPDNAVGLLGADWLREPRFRNLDALRRRTAEILRERDVQGPIELSPNQATELLTAAQDEGRETLAELWARLLANAMDPNLNNVRNSFIDPIKKMDPPDAAVLRCIQKNNIAVIFLGGTSDITKDIGTQNIAQITGIREDEIEVSLRHLQTLSFLDKIANHNDNRWFVNAPCREFLRACYPENNS